MGVMYSREGEGSQIKFVDDDYLGSYRILQDLTQSYLGY